MHIAVDYRPLITLIHVAVQWVLGEILGSNRSLQIEDTALSVNFFLFFFEQRLG